MRAGSKRHTVKAKAETRTDIGFQIVEKHFGNHNVVAPLHQSVHKAFNLSEMPLLMPVTIDSYSHMPLCFVRYEYLSPGRCPGRQKTLHLQIAQQFVDAGACLGLLALRQVAAAENRLIAVARE